MEVEYTGRQTKINKKHRMITDEAMARIVKVVGSHATAHVILTAEKYRMVAEVSVKTRTHTLVAKCESTEMETALRDALAKVEKQAIRKKQKKTTAKRRSKADIKSIAGREAEAKPEAVTPVKARAKAPAKNSAGRKAVPMLVHSFPSTSQTAEPHVVRSTENVALRPMTLDEAVKEAEFRDRDVFVFRDMSGNGMVLHRKRDGKLELIEVP